ncbi:MAG: T9SS C-terminal target domain-containing protein [Crocinitomicaceae bacterium]|nr:T9SS C-terminal target domain-containing protein [Crocinitomicaceae bacterium]
MTNRIIIMLIGLFLFWYGDVQAYYSIKDQENGIHNKSMETNLAKGAGCAPSSARITMSFNDVSALIDQGGSMFQNRNNGTAAYEIPKGSGLKVIFSGALWMGGTDVTGQLKLAAIKFRDGQDFWAGPLTVNAGSGSIVYGEPIGPGGTYDFGPAAISQEVCESYDKFYTIRKAEVIRYAIWWDACAPGGTGICTDDIIEPTNDELNRIFNWPAHGDVSMNQDRYLAPFYDHDHDLNYDPENGDYPWYDDILGRNDIECGVDRRISLYGDETNWWVFNDRGNIHTETNGDPIGMEIRAQAFAFATNDEVNRMTFYNYELINRGTQTLENTYFSQYLDADIGGATDDYVGCDVSRGLGFTYNGEEYDDGNAGNLGYGDNPPAIGCDFFEGPYQDPDGIDNPGPWYDSTLGDWVTPTVEEALAGDGIVYRGVGVGYGDLIPDNERFGMRRFTYYTGTSGYPYSDPENASEFYNYMSGAWANGSQMFFGGLGYAGTPGATQTLCEYMFPGDSDPLDWGTQGEPTSFNWTELQNDASGSESSDVGDRRMVQSAGPFTLRPGAVNNITVGIVYGRGTEGAYSSVEAMKRADTKAQALFDACFRILTPPDAPKLRIQELENQLILTLENPSSSNNYLETYEEVDDINITDPQWTADDKTYKFEGYQIYQMVDKDATISDLLSPEKARLIRQCDIENDIDRLVNFEFDEGLGFPVPIERVDGENKGIKHSFLITEDAFASGDRQLVNHKKYYFIAIAYAHNEFKKYESPSLDGQKIPYISSRLSFDGTAIKSMEGVPHNPMPEADGTQQNVAYGSTPIITRLDGHGNGGRSLEFTSSSESYIFENGFMENPSYNYGRGPINVKVVDPLNLVGGYFECKFRDYVPTLNFNAANDASWTIIHYDKKNGEVIDSVRSQSTITVDNEQIIAKWGISVQIQQENAFMPDGDTSVFSEVYTNRPISSSISFADSSQPWLSFVQDDNSFSPTNWIESGDYEPQIPGDCIPSNPNYYDPCFYGDQIGADPDRLYEEFLDGGFAPHKLTRYSNDYAPMAYYRYPNPVSPRNSASISYLPSVDIILTNDPSKWTRCAVIELGRDTLLNIGNARPGDLRQSLSVDRNGVPDGSNTYGMGWFPGYAIDLESGARLHMAFGENSFLVNENGSDMIWNPTDRINDVVGTTPLMGGMQPIYIFNYKNKTVNNYASIYDYPEYNPDTDNDVLTNRVYQDMQVIRNQPTATVDKLNFYQSIGWIGFPVLTPGYSFNVNSAGEKTVFPCDVRISLRVNREYKNFVGSGENNGRPMYSWNMDDIRTVTGSSDQLAEALRMINVVPNPYNAYSEYENSRLDTRVKITNLPERCVIRIYSVNGKLIRTFKKDSPITSLDWDLNNHKRIPVAGGVYLIHVDVPGIGERVLKFFMAARQVDLQGT